MSRLYWIAAVLLLAVEAAIVLLMLTPQVSADYRAYYLERSTSCWPRAVTGRYRLGQPVSFRDDPDGRAAIRHRQCGWIAPFEAGSWSRGDRARLYFAFDVPTAGVDIALLANGYVGEGHPSQRVAVSVNGVLLDELLFTPQSQDLRVLRVSPDVAGLDAAGLTIQFDFPDRISPAAMGVSDDSRELGMLLAEMMIVAPAP